MKVILATVMSVDGKITKWGNPKLHGWTSKEDQQHFAEMIEAHSAIIMGRKTFDAARNMIVFPNPKLRIVMTRTPRAHTAEAAPGMLEFTDRGPRTIVANLKRRRHKTALLAGGGEINGLFLAGGCVDELWLTIEPKVFGSGNELVAAGELDVQMELLDIERLNERGTLLLKYGVRSQQQGGRRLGQETR